MIGEIKDVYEILWNLMPPHIRKQLRARAGDFLPLSVIPTNHDLQRAVRIAWVEAAIQITEPVMKEAANAARDNAGAINVVTFAKLFSKEIRERRHADLNRTEPLHQSPIDAHVEQILDLAGKWIGGLAKGESEVPVTEGFRAAAAALTGLDPDQVPPRFLAAAQDGVGQPPRSFGALLFDELAELIKGDKYPEVREAFQIRLQALLQEQLDRIEDKIDQTPDRVVEKIRDEIVPGLADTVAAKVGVSVEQIQTTITAALRKAVAEENARTEGPIDPAVLRQRIDALAMTLVETEVNRRPDDALEAKLEQMRMLALNDQATRAAELFDDTFKTFELDEQHARALSAARGQRLLRIGINQAVAAGHHDLAATRIIAKALLAGGSAAAQFKELTDAKREWERQTTTPMNRFIVWRIAEAMDKHGALDAARAFAGASAAGRARIDIQFGNDPFAWRMPQVVRLLRNTRAEGIQAMVAAMRKAPQPREVDTALESLLAYATRLGSATPLADEPDAVTEIWELRSLLLAWPDRIRTHETKPTPMRRVFDHATMRLLSRGTGIDSLPAPIRQAIVGGGTGLTPYSMPFMVKFCSLARDDAAKPLSTEAALRKSWGPDNAADGVKRLEHALTIAKTHPQPPLSVAEVHEVIGVTYRERFWWEGDIDFARKAEPHLSAAADLQKTHDPNGAMATIVARARDQLRELIRIATTEAAPTPPQPPPRRSWL